MYVCELTKRRYRGRKPREIRGPDDVVALVGSRLRKEKREQFLVLLADVSKGAHVPGAMLRYSLASVLFTKRVSAIPVPAEEANQAEALAHQFLNHFLDLYRFTAKDSAILPLTWAEFHEVRAGRALQCTTAPEDPAVLSKAAGRAPVMLASFGVAFRDEDPITLRFGRRSVLEEADEVTFRKNLSEGLTPNLPALLLLNAEHYCVAALVDRTAVPFARPAGGA